MLRAIMPWSMVLLLAVGLSHAAPAMSEMLKPGGIPRAGGKLTVGSWRKLGAFPLLKDPAFTSVQDAGNGSRISFDNGAATLGITAEGVRFFNRGRSNDDALGTAAMLVFTPETSGHYALQGTLRVGKDGPTAKSIAWAVFRVPASWKPTEPVELIVDGRARQGTVIDLAGQTGYQGQSLGTLPLERADRLCLTVWYAPMYNGGGALLTDFDIAAVPAPPAPPPAQPLVSARTSEDRRYPADAGLIDVTKPPYNIKPDGVTDVTQVLQQAMSEHNRETLFLPNGTYLVSRQLRWQTKNGDRISHLMLLGESREGTIIRLRDNCPRFRDADVDLNDGEALAVLRTESDSGPPDAAIENYIRNLTVDTGKNNPGAIGISFIGNNIAAVENVSIRSGDGAGMVGLAMTRIPGPCLIKNVSIDGFQWGIRLREFLYNVVCEDIVLRNQGTAGILNPAGVLTIHGLRSINKVPVLLNPATPRKPAQEGDPVPPPRKQAMVQLIDAHLEGGDPKNAAIINGSHIYLRRIRTEGYRAALQDEDQPTPARDIDEFVSGPILQQFDAPPRALRLPIAPTPPSFHTNDFTQWVNVRSFAHLYHYLNDPAPDPARTPPLAEGQAPIESGQRQGSVDCTQAIQAALDSGKSIVYFPRGTYKISRTLRVPPTVRRICGMRSKLQLMDGPEETFCVPGSEAPMFRIEGDTEAPLEIELVDYNGGPGRQRNASVMVQHASKRPLVIRHSVFSGYRNTPGCGPLFLENVCGTNFKLIHPQQAYFRQVNPEGHELRLYNNGGQLWCLGVKTEGEDTVCQTVGGGQTEIIGAFLRPSAKDPMSAPAYIIEDAAMSIISCSMTWAEKTGPRLDRTYHYQVRETRQGVTRDLTRPDLIAKGLGARDDVMIPLYVGFAKDAYQPRPVTYVPAKPTYPSPWELRDIGQPSDTGVARFLRGGSVLMIEGNGSFTAGVNRKRVLGDDRDACAFAHVKLDGDGTLIARIAGVSQVYGPQYKAGLMLRQSLADDAPMVFLGHHARSDAEKSLILLRRAKAGEKPASYGSSKWAMPLYLKLERRGTRVQAFISIDGATWQTLGDPVESFTGPALIGIAIAGANGTHSATALISDIQLTDGQGRLLAGRAKPDLPQPWQHDDTAPTQPGHGLIHPGRVQFDGSRFLVTGSGWVFDPRDYYHYVFQIVPRGKQLVARVQWQTPGDKLPALAQAGLALRYFPVEQSRKINLALTPNELVWTQKLQRSGEPGPKRLPVEPRAGVWLKLAYTDTKIIGYVSTDGAAWKQVAAADAEDAPEGLCLGFYATSGNLLEQATAIFEQVSVSDINVPPPAR